MITGSFGKDLARVVMDLKDVDSPITKDRIAKPFWSEAHRLKEENEKMKDMLYRLYKGDLETCDNSFYRSVEKLLPEKFDSSSIEEIEKYIE